MMQWNSLSEFLAMGGYGFYVWVSFGVTAVCMIWEVVAVQHRHTMALKNDGLGEGLRRL
jgi:heme exporter protein D